MSGLHTSVSALAEQRGMGETPRSKPRTFKRGDIVQIVLERRTLYAYVLSYGGKPNSQVKTIDLRCMVHRRDPKSVRRVQDASELPDLTRKFAELLKSRKGLAAITPVKSDWSRLPESGGGAPQRCDIPYVLRDKSHAAWPSQRLINYVSGPSDREILRMSGQRDRRLLLDAEWQSLQSKWRLRQVLGNGRRAA